MIARKVSGSAAAVVKPPLGSPPSIEWIGVDRLAVDETYQRSCANPASEALINRIALGWDWRLFQPLACARRGDGSIVVIDGQHRLLGARRRGDIPHLPCVVGSFESIAEEARVFAAMNRQRKAMTNLDLYRAQIAAGDAGAVEALAVIHDAGLKLARHTNPTAWKPREIACIGGVVRAIAQYGNIPVRRSLGVIAGAYPDERLIYAGTLLDPVARVVRNHDSERVRVIIASRDQDFWRTIAIQPGTLTKTSPSAAVEAAILAKMAPVSAALPALPVQQKRRKTFEEELEAAKNGTAVFVERVPMPSRPATQVLGGSSLS